MRLISDDAIATITIFQEAEGEPMDGKIAVGEVIRNRMTTHYNSDGTILGTCLRAYQFSGWNTASGNRLRSCRADSTNPAVADCSVAWQQSEDTDTVKGAVLYFNPALVKPPPAWAEASKLVAVIGNHQFYTG